MEFNKKKRGGESSGAGEKHFKKGEKSDTNNQKALGDGKTKPKEEDLTIKGSDDMIEDINRLSGFIKSMVKEEDIMKLSKEWISQRKVTLENLENFKKGLNSVHCIATPQKTFGAIATLAGSSFAMAGAATTLISKDPGTKALGRDFVKVGTGVALIGSLNNALTDVAEIWFSQPILDDLKKVLDKDKKITEELRFWLKRSQELEEHFQKIFGFSVLSDSINIFQVVDELKEGIANDDTFAEKLLNALTANTYDMLGLKLNYIKGIIQSGSEWTKSFLKMCCTNKSVQEAVFALFKSLKEMKMLIPLTTMFATVKKTEIPRTLILKALPVTFQDLILKVPVTELLVGISFAFSVWEMISALKDEGKSKYNDLLEKIIKCLKNETDAILEFISNY